MYITHGMSNTPTWSSWRAMRKRCLDPNANQYENYGGIGITIDPKWNTFEGFYEDMGDRPYGYSLDRINPNGNYTKDNCRWASDGLQRNNQKKLPGRIYKNGNKWAVRFQGNTIIPPIFKSFNSKLEAEQFRIKYIEKYL